MHCRPGGQPGPANGVVSIWSPTFTGAVQLAACEQLADAGHLTNSTWFSPKFGVLPFPNATYTVPSGPGTALSIPLKLSGKLTRQSTVPLVPLSLTARRHGFFVQCWSTA